MDERMLWESGGERERDGEKKNKRKTEGGKTKNGEDIKGER